MKQEHFIGIAVVAFIGLIYVSRKSIVKLKDYMTRPEFINDFTPVVKAASKGTGLFPSVFMAQAILESSDSQGRPGMSSLTKSANNFFGIKADPSWQGDIITKPTTEFINGKKVVVNAKFRKYEYPENSFFDRVKFLMAMPRYAKYGVFTADSPGQQTKALQTAGYATNPKYAALLDGIISKYNLTNLDS